MSIIGHPGPPAGAPFFSFVQKVVLGHSSGLAARFEMMELQMVRRSQLVSPTDLITS